MAKKLVDRDRNEWDDISETVDMRSLAGKKEVDDETDKNMK